MFYEIQNVRDKCIKLYTSGKVFQDYIVEEELFPYVLTLKVPTQKQVVQMFSTLLSEVEVFTRSKLNIEYKRVNYKSIGTQNLPTKVHFNSRRELLIFIAKEEEFSHYCNLYKRSVDEFNSLTSLFYNKPKLLLQNFDQIDSILKVITFCSQNPNPLKYIRELSIETIDSKFIENNKKVLDLFLENVLDPSSIDDTVMTLSKGGFEKKYGLKYPSALIRFRILDPDLYINGLSDLTIPIEQFKALEIACEKVYIVENKITTLSFPNLDKSIVIFGQGYGVGVLKDIAWLKRVHIFYFGDIDMDGFNILSQARRYYPQIRSLLMNIEVINMFKTLAVSSSAKMYKKLNHLSKEEQLIYDRLNSNYYLENFRLEQEKIPFDYVCKNL